jgi:hypothetical protein
LHRTTSREPLLHSLLNSPDRLGDAAVPTVDPEHAEFEFEAPFWSTGSFNWRSPTLRNDFTQQLTAAAKPTEKAVITTRKPRHFLRGARKNFGDA